MDKHMYCIWAGIGVVFRFPPRLFQGFLDPTQSFSRERRRSRAEAMINVESDDHEHNAAHRRHHHHHHYNHPTAVHGSSLVDQGEIGVGSANLLATSTSVRKRERREKPAIHRLGTPLFA